MMSHSSKVKYLSIILDSKLEWNRNIEVRIGKALSAECLGLDGRTLSY